MMQPVGIVKIEEQRRAAEKWLVVAPETDRQTPLQLGQ
jgi:hypothetical protein